MMRMHDPSYQTCLESPSVGRPGMALRRYDTHDVPTPHLDQEVLHYWD